jgi:hypothetical protein
MLASLLVMLAKSDRDLERGSLLGPQIIGTAGESQFAILHEAARHPHLGLLVVSQGARALTNTTDQWTPE